MATAEVQLAERTDRPAWQRMWSAYCAHYGASLSAAENDELWSRIMDPGHPIGALVCYASGAENRPLGFAHYLLHPHTFSDRMVCYLEDLWVEPAARGAGIGRELIEALIAQGRDQGWRRLYWHTEADNTPARALYNRIVAATDYVRYDVALP